MKPKNFYSNSFDLTVPANPVEFRHKVGVMELEPIIREETDIDNLEKEFYEAINTNSYYQTKLIAIHFGSKIINKNEINFVSDYYFMENRGEYPVPRFTYNKYKCWILNNWDEESGKITILDFQTIKFNRLIPVKFLLSVSFSSL